MCGEMTESGTRSELQTKGLGNIEPGEGSDIETALLPCREEHRQNSADWLTEGWGVQGRSSGGCRTKSTLKSPWRMTLGLLEPPQGWATRSAQVV